jgi:hypothetical protein
MINNNKRLIGILLTVAFLLLIPLIGRAPWSAFDFVVASVLLLGTGLMFELVMRTVKKTKHRIALSAAILAGLFLIWVELAVGLFGTPFAGS